MKPIFWSKTRYQSKYEEMLYKLEQLFQKNEAFLENRVITVNRKDRDLKLYVPNRVLVKRSKASS